MVKAVAWFTILVAVPFIMAVGTGFVAYEAWETGVTLYVGPLNMSLGLGAGSWFPGNYL